MKESSSSEAGGVEPIMESVLVVFTVGDCSRISLCSEAWYTGKGISLLSHDAEKVSDAVKGVSESSVSPVAEEMLSICTSRVVAKVSRVAAGLSGSCRERSILCIY